MRTAHIYAQLSSCKRRKVGCVIVKDDSIISIGYNGTPPGEDNCCEDATGTTKSTTIHAEDNALRKLTRSTESAKGGTMILTCAPCILCAPRIVESGVTEVYYDDVYSKTDGIEYLERRNIKIEQFKEGAGTFGDGSIYFARFSDEE